MILLQGSHIYKQFQGAPVLTDCNLVIQDGDRTALLGPNGAGKSTLLKILVGQVAADSGTVSIAKETTIGYVPQTLEVPDRDISLFDFVADSFHELLDLEQRIRDMEKLMANPAVYQSEDGFRQLSTRYDALQKQFADADGYAVEARVRRVLNGLAFPAETWDDPVQSLSGGQKTRLSLARLLAQEPRILVLDEPTNYLDMETLTWLESYLSGYVGAVLLVSHDRYFLDALCTLVYELSGGVTSQYVGNYTDYTVQKAQQTEVENKRFESQQAEISRLETFVQKNLVRSSTSKRAKSRKKLLERIVRLEKPEGGVPRPTVQFTALRPTGKDVLLVANLAIGYGSKVLCKNLNLHVRRGERVAVVGQNGIGKTTLLKTLAGQVPALKGTVNWGNNVDIGVYDQEQSDLNLQKTVFATIHDEFPQLSLTAVRTALGRFLFQGEDVNKLVSAISGGERSLVALCRLMLRQANVLIMDEPTNHLDLFTKEALEAALSDYDGTLIFVSHDRYFIDALATHVLHLDASGHRLYLGNYTDYIAKTQDEEAWTPSRNDSEGRPASSKQHSIAHPRQTKESVGSSPEKPLQTPAVHPGPVRSADLRKQRERVELLEKKIDVAEKRQEEISQALVKASMSSDPDAVVQLREELSQMESQHESLLEQWDQEAAKLEEMDALDAKFRGRQQ